MPRGYEVTEGQELTVDMICVPTPDVPRIARDGRSFRKLKKIQQSYTENNLTSTKFTELYPCEKHIDRLLFKTLGES